MILKIKKLRPDVRLPEYALPGDAGMDFYVPETVDLLPGERKSIPLGISFEIPEGYVGLFWDKSGLSHTFGIKSFGGVIDSGYRGEVQISLMNFSDKPYHLEKGHKIIQLLLQPVERAVISEVDELSPSFRGTGRFGSTGK